MFPSKRKEQKKQNERFRQYPQGTTYEPDDLKNNIASWYYRKELSDYDTITITGETEKAYRAERTTFKNPYQDREKWHYDSIDEKYAQTFFIPKSVIQSSAQTARDYKYTENRKKQISEIFEKKMGKFDSKKAMADAKAKFGDNKFKVMKEYRQEQAKFYDYRNKLNAMPYDKLKAEAKATGVAFKLKPKNK